MLVEQNFQRVHRGGKLAPGLSRHHIRRRIGKLAQHPVATLAERRGGLIHRLAIDFKRLHLTALEPSMLRDCRTLYRLYPQIHQSAIGELPSGARLQVEQSLIAESAIVEKRQPVVGESGQRLPSLLPAST
jgi:hypothetical protein